MSLGRLLKDFGGLDGADLLRAMRDEFGDGLAVISSFGAEAAVLLALVAEVDRTIPVIFLDTGELFDETLAYQRQLTEFLGLSELRRQRPTAEELAAAEELWRSDADACCQMRKVAPLARAVAGLRALVDGRKRYHGGGRETIQVIEEDADGIIKISPLARWTAADIEAAFLRRGLPRHPLVAQGYRSIGCWPCSRPSLPGEEVRAGRWAGGAKTECGIHRTKTAL
ncbi:MAG TPA: phosphoadenylyl-sulfate reductase [Rhodospirillaceae bacterium]|nr:phosphoadenylyl-sulfate reductase [Rhodospirillaceae bacterium]